MMPTIHSKFSHDYRFLPELLMPIVTIDEVQNEAVNSRISKESEERRVSKEGNLKMGCRDKGSNKKSEANKAEKAMEIIEQMIKKEPSENNDQTLLVPKVEKDIENDKPEQANSIVPINLKIKEEKQDPEENTNTDEENSKIVEASVNDSDLMKSVAKLIQMASEKQKTMATPKITAPEKTSPAPPVTKQDEVTSTNKIKDDEVVNKIDNTDTDDTTPIKRKRGRPRKNPEEKVTTKKKIKGKKSKKSKMNKAGKAKKNKKQEVDDSNLPKYPCPICKGEEKRTEKQLRLHYKNDHGGRRLRTAMLSTEMVPCEVCGKAFRSSYHLKEHMETHNNYYNCDVCTSSHRKVLDYVIHMRIHSEKGFFKCVFCSFITEEIVQITEHLNGSHDEFPQYVCQICKKGFNILSWFEEHENFHSGSKPFTCDLCGKNFMYSRYLSAHRNFMHKEELGNLNIHECVICHKQYQHRNSLKLHMNSHTGNFAICDVCGKILSSREKLKFHMRTHTGYKPFDCTYCGKCFTKKPILVEHIRIHTGERPYVCEYCTKAFSQRSSLVIHIRSHTGERPFVCHLCQKGFVAKAMLNIHLKTCKGLIAFD